MLFPENRLPADDSQEKACLICYFREKKIKILNCRLLQIIGGASMVINGRREDTCFGVCLCVVAIT